MKSYSINATPEARDRLVTYFNEIVDRRNAGEWTDVGQYASRWAEQAARLAITLHAALYGAEAHQHPLGLESAEKAVTLAKWFADQQLNLLAKGRQSAKTKIEDEVIELLKENQERKGREFVTAREVHHERITDTPDAARTLLAGMEADGMLVGEDIIPARGGRPTRRYRIIKNPVAG